jgi:hypothetical protein
MLGINKDGALPPLESTTTCHTADALLDPIRDLAINGARTIVAILLLCFWALQR